MNHLHYDMADMSSMSSMVMSSATTDMPTSTMMSMGTSTSNMDMSSNSMSDMDHNSMSMSMNMGVFYWRTTGDGIWLPSWVPESEGAYIGACFGLFFISVLSRTLPAYEAYFIAWKRNQDNKIHGNQLLSPDVEQSRKGLNDTSLQYQTSYPSPLALPSVPPFSWSTDIMRSFLTVLTAFVGYLLMMVVMTGNGGYFLSVILGIFVGEVAFGRFRSLNGFTVDEHSH